MTCKPPELASPPTLGTTYDDPGNSPETLLAPPGRGYGRSSGVSIFQALFEGDGAGEACGRMAGVPTPLKSAITALAAGIDSVDDLGREHRNNALAWLAGTDDIFRREKPRTPSPHLVSYFLLVDRSTESFLLCDHRLSGLWLPTGGHVEPGEHPLDTVRREVVEELGVTARFDAAYRDKPFFLTMTETVGPPAMRHVDVSLWFALGGHVGQPLHPDEREFVQVRWWNRGDLEHADTDRMEPHLLRALDALGLDP